MVTRHTVLEIFQKKTTCQLIKPPLFDIGSITNSFTTLLLADMATQGIVNLNNPIEKYLPYSVKVPQFKGH